MYGTKPKWRAVLVVANASILSSGYFSKVHVIFGFFKYFFILYNLYYIDFTVYVLTISLTNKQRKKEIKKCVWHTLFVGELKMDLSLRVMSDDEQENHSSNKPKRVYSHHFVDKYLCWKSKMVDPFLWSKIFLDYHFALFSFDRFS